MATQEPTVFNDRYELHRQIARGGMADVYLARDLLLDRPVAVLKFSSISFQKISSLLRGFVEKPKEQLI